MKKCIITGFACPKEAWYKVFPQQEGTNFISLADVLDNCQSADLRVLAKSIESQIEIYQPDVVIMHDFGVALGLLALINIHKRNQKFSPKVVLFNGALGGLNLLKAHHPFTLQLLNFEKIRKIVRLSGGKCDERLKPHFSRIKKIYRQVILISLLTMIKKLFGKSTATQYDLGNKILILASDNDPYIPLECLHKIAADFKNATLEVMQYGHYPYSFNEVNLFRERIAIFVNS